MPEAENRSVDISQQVVLAGQAQAEKPQLVYLERVEHSARTETEPSGLMEYWQLIRRRKLLLSFCVLVGGLAGWTISLLETPVYQGRASLEIQTTRSSEMPSEFKQSDSGGFTAESYLQTQVKVLQSRWLRQRVLERLKKQHPTAAPLVPSRLNELKKAFGLHSGVSDSQSQVLASAETRIKVSDNSRIIEILCDSASPTFAADYANVMANEFIDSNLEALWQSSQRIANWLTRQMGDLRQKLQQSEDALQSYSQHSGLIITSGHSNTEEESLKSVQEQLLKAQADRMAKQSSYEIAMAASVDSVPQVADNGRLSEYQTKLTELRAEMADLGTFLTPTHYRVTRLQAQIGELESALQREKANTLRRITNDYDAAKRDEQLLTNEYTKRLQMVSEKARKTIFYGILNREAEANRQLYEELLRKVKQVGIGSTLQASNMRILDTAEVPTHPYKPDPLRSVLMGAVSGMLLAVAAVIGREYINRSLRAPGEAPFHLRLPELGVIPYKGSLDGNGGWLGVRRNPRSLGTGNGNHAECLELATWQNKPSLLAESFRSAVASILVARPGGRRPRVIMVTSAERGDGKSSMVSNLGIALAEIHQRVVLIDADLRKPRLHEIFGTPNSWGLSDILRENIALQDYPRETLTRKTKVEGLFLLPSGPGTANIATLFYSTRMTDLMLRLRKDFDMVLIDTPPMSYLFDARVLGQLADGAILVIRASQTTRDAAQGAKQRLVEDGIRVLGTILNGWDLKARTRYGSDYNHYTHPYNS